MEYTNEALVRLALKARENAYCPYSGIAVGAALLCEGGEVFLGANMENAAFGATICAERTAFGAAIAKGHRRFLRIAVVGGERDREPDRFFPPCGTCRQVMAEFCGTDFEILLYDGEKTDTLTLGKLLPEGFGAQHF